MRAITYARHGDASVLELVERAIPEPGEGEIRIRVLTSGVNPTDWKSRSGGYGRALTEQTVPNQDGAGIVDETGPGVDGLAVGDRVWVTLAADGRPASGTAQEYTVVPAERAFPLPRGADVELGASIGIPGVTAHRALDSCGRWPDAAPAQRPRRQDRAGRRWCRGRRQRRNPARPVGGRDGDRNGER